MTLNPLLCTSTEKEILSVERAISDLRRGFFVIIHDHNRFILIVATENLTEHTLDLAKSFADHDKFITLIKNRAAYIFPQLKDKCTINIALQNMTPTQLKDLASSDVKLSLDDYKFTPSGTLERSALQLLKYAHLLPSAITIDISQMQNIEEFISANQLQLLKSSSITSFKHMLTENQVELCRTPLNLKYAEQTQVISFRSTFAGDEHYAIIVGEMDPTKIPTVRVHSLCFTGDLLGSLSCDCGDQLRDALSYMGNIEGGFGIIVYLMQEGRDIGLVNKLRSYKLQSQGIDTVDANLILGFDDDERSFLPAAKILEHLNCNKIKLLSNNPRKADGLTKYGIEVVEIVPLIIEPQEHNQAYMKTKSDRLGHIL
jgi:GTP cyclohydrolase II